MSLPTEVLLLVLESLAGPSQEDNWSQTDGRQCLWVSLQVSRNWNRLSAPLLWRWPICRRPYQLERLMRTLESSYQGKTMHAYHRFIRKLSFGHFMHRYLNDAMWSRLWQFCGSHGLRSLHLSASRNVTDEVLREAVVACPLLERLVLQDDPQQPSYSRSALFQLLTIGTPSQGQEASDVTSSGRLREVGLHGVRAVDDHLLLALAQSQPQLEQLVVFDGGSCSAQMVVSLLAQCPRLQSLYLTQPMKEGEELFSSPTAFEKELKMLDVKWLVSGGRWSIMKSYPLPLAMDPFKKDSTLTMESDMIRRRENDRIFRA